MWPKLLAIALLILFSKNSLSLNIFRTREDSTIKSWINKNVCRKVFWKKKLLQRRINLRNNVCRGKFLNPIQKNDGPSLKPPVPFSRASSAGPQNYFCPINKLASATQASKQVLLDPLAFPRNYVPDLERARFHRGVWFWRKNYKKYK